MGEDRGVGAPGVRGRGSGVGGRGGGGGGGGGGSGGVRWAGKKI